MPVPDELVWRDGEAGATPLSAERLNLMQDWIDGRAQDAEESASAAEVSAAAAAAPTDATVAALLGTTSSTQTAADGRYAWAKSAKTFGATGDGVTDDTTTVQAAITASPAVVFPPGTYRVGNLTVPSNRTLILLPGAILRGVATGQVLTAAGTEGTPVNVTANVAAGARTITATSHGLVAGDWFRLGSTTQFDASSTFSTIGELLQVESVSGSTITTSTPVVGGPYNTAATATVSKITAVENILITGGGTVQGNKVTASGQMGLGVQYGRHIRVEDVTFKDLDQRHLFFRDCVDVGVDRCVFDWAIHTSQAYGVSFSDACQDSWVSHCTFRYVRHSMTTNNTTGGKGIPRRIRFSDNTVLWTSTATGGSMAGGDAIDTHTAAEDIWIERNTVVGSAGQGINFEARSGRIVGNTIIRPVSSGIYVHNESDLNGYVIVEGNLVVSPGNHGIVIQGATRGATSYYERIICALNTVRGVTSGSDAYQVGASAPTNVDQNVTVVNNAAVACTATNLFLVRSALALIYSGNTIAGSTGAVSVVDQTNGDPGYVSKTILSDAIAVDASMTMVSLTPETSTTDALATITGGRKGQFLALRVASAANTITLTHSTNTNGLRLTGATNYGLTGLVIILLWFNGSSWLEVARSV